MGAMMVTTGQLAAALTDMGVEQVFDIAGGHTPIHCRKGLRTMACVSMSLT